MTDETKNAVFDYFNSVISHSWTWERLTDKEKECFKTCIDFGRIQGSKRQRITTLNMIYSAFLHGVGYTPTNWREPDTDAPQF